MDYQRITTIKNPLFAQMHALMQKVFPAEEVLEFGAWEGPLQDQSLRVCVAVEGGEVVGATEYRYLADLQVAMTDFTIIGKSGAGIGRFLWVHREADLKRMAAASGRPSLGMFAEVYDPGRVTELSFGGVPAMHPVVRREVLSHMGYRRLDFPYVHPSWQQDGAAVTNLDLCFLPDNAERADLPARLVADFLTRYYAILERKPDEWHEMVRRLHGLERIPLRPL